MCHAVRCTVCAKTTWAGCGHHADQVLAGVPRGDRCPGHPTRALTGHRSVFTRLVGRR